MNIEVFKSVLLLTITIQFASPNKTGDYYDYSLVKRLINKVYDSCLKNKSSYRLVPYHYLHLLNNNLQLLYFYALESEPLHLIAKGLTR
jgi:hypothetical protein